MHGLSSCMSVSSIIIEIKILLRDQILDYFVCHSVYGTKFFIYGLKF
jgi:hypothetical protein